MTIHSHDHATLGSAAHKAPEDIVQRAFAALEKCNALTTTRVWTPGRQAAFLAMIAEGATVAKAAGNIGVVERTAYSFRRRVAGELFDIGWRAANLLARDKLHDELYERALNGQTIQETRDDGERVVSVTRQRFDNRLAVAVMTRLDRLADDRAPDMDTVRLIAANFDTYLAHVTADMDVDDVIGFLRERAADEAFDLRAKPVIHDDKET